LTAGDIVDEVLGLAPTNVSQGIIDRFVPGDRLLNRLLGEGRLQIYFNETEGYGSTYYGEAGAEIEIADHPVGLLGRLAGSRWWYRRMYGAVVAHERVHVLAGQSKARWLRNNRALLEASGLSEQEFLSTANSHAEENVAMRRGYRKLGYSRFLARVKGRMNMNAPYYSYLRDTKGMTPKQVWANLLTAQAAKPKVNQLMFSFMDPEPNVARVSRLPTLKKVGGNVALMLVMSNDNLHRGIQASGERFRPYTAPIDNAIEWALGPIPAALERLANNPIIDSVIDPVECVGNLARWNWNDDWSLSWTGSFAKGNGKGCWSFDYPDRKPWRFWGLGE
jgi:hypothetical protein